MWERITVSSCRLAPYHEGKARWKGKEQRMNLGKEGWIGWLGSVCQLPRYLGMAEQTLELRTQLSLRSCKCSVSLVEGLSPSKALFLQELLWQPFAFTQKRHCTSSWPLWPLVLGWLCFFSFSFFFPSFFQSYNLETQLPFKAVRLEWFHASLVLLVASIDCNTAPAGVKLAGWGAGSSEHAILRLAQVAHGLCPPETASCKLSNYAMHFATGKMLSQILSGNYTAAPVFFYSFFLLPPPPASAGVPGPMFSSQGKVLYQYAKSGLHLDAKC